MRQVKQNLEVPVRSECDVLVIGAGPAGMGAAIAAARKGARVTLVEYGGKLGGMWTLGLLSPFFDNQKEGLNREIREKLMERKAWGGLWNMSFDPVEMALLMNRYAVELKMDVLLYTMACEPFLEDRTVRGVFVQNKSGRQLILAKVVIDCTGDGDIAARAGCPFEIGRPSDGAFQPMTMMFKLGGLRKDYSSDRLHDWYEILEERVKDKARFLEDVPFTNPALIKLPREDEALIQWTHIRKYSGCSGDELSRATQEGFRQVELAMSYFELIRDVLGDVYLAELPAVIGVRETRRITGEYHISDEDLKEGHSQPDSVCTVYFGVDIHEPSSEQQTGLPNPGFDIPFRSLVPLNAENLLTAGRCISGSYLAHAAYRVTGDCLQMGEAAGERACEAIRRGISVRDLARQNS